MFGASSDGGDKDCVLECKEVAKETVRKVQKSLGMALRLSSGDGSAAIKMLGTMTTEGLLPEHGVVSFVEQCIVEMAVVGTPQGLLVIAARVKRLSWRAA